MRTFVNIVLRLREFSHKRPTEGNLDIIVFYSLIILTISQNIFCFTFWE